MCNEEIRSEEEQEGPAPSLVSGDGPLIFIAHDSRDAELAEAFSELLKAVSVGLLRSFRSSDQKGTEGIEYGQQWFPEIMGKLERATQVVCLLTRRSLDRPWILYEAGVATGKASTRVHGLALGIPFSRVNTGPFAQFQNCDGSNLESVTKLIMELMEQIPGADPQPDTLRPQVEAFLETAAGIMQSAEEGDTSSEEEVPVDEAAVARLFEEIKGMFQDLPSRVQGMLEESLGPAAARRRRRFHPMLLEDLTMQAQDDPSLAWLMLMGFVRDEVPWVYEAGMELYRAMKSGRPRVVQRVADDFRRVVDFTTGTRAGAEMLEASRETREMLMVLDMASREMLARMAHRPEEEPGQASAGAGEFPTPSEEAPRPR